MCVGISCKVLDGFDRILTKFVVVLQIFTRIYKYQFHENLSSGSLVDSRGQSDGRTERNEEANNNFLRLCEPA